MVWSTQFSLGGVYSLVCLLKFIIHESHLDTNATTSMIQNKTSNLYIYIQKVGKDITNFNTYILKLIDTLAFRGETTQYLFTNILKGYGACTKTFSVEYIQNK